jgi:hypothetical protein
VVGWLFARSTSINAPNGYQLTGMYPLRRWFPGKPHGLFISYILIYWFPHKRR